MQLKVDRKIKKKKNMSKHVNCKNNNTVKNVKS